MGRPFPPSRGKVPKEGASQIPGTSDSTVRQLKPPTPATEKDLSARDTSAQRLIQTPIH